MTSRSCKLLEKSQGICQPIIPRTKLKDFGSRTATSTVNVLFCARFCPSPSSGHLLAICDEEGYVSIINTHSKKQPTAKTWSAHENAIFAFEWTCKGDRIVTVSGDQTAVLWDAETSQKICTFRGHRGSIKTVSACPFDSNKFMTGSRDGAVMVWDARNRVKDEFGGVTPIDVISPAHFNPYNVGSCPPAKGGAKRNSSLSTTQPKRNVARRSSARVSQNWRSRVEPVRSCECGGAPGSPASVSAVLFHEDTTILSGATTRTGIRVWDLRKTHKNLVEEPSPYHTFIYPRIGNRQRGYTCFSMDRYRSKLYAACTDSVIYEYSLTNMLSKPVNQLRGADIDSFYIQIACCPVEDFLLAGSSAGIAQIWDLSPRHGAGSGLSTLTGSLPAFALDVDTTEVTAVAWSGTFDRLVTCDDYSWRLWSLDDQGNGGELGVVRIKEVRGKEVEKAAEALIGLIVTPARKVGQATPTGSPQKEQHNADRDHGINRHSELINKRKLAFRSPLKQIGEKDTSRGLFQSPKAKKCLLKTEKNSARSRVDNPFYYPTPTTNLPNLVAERFRSMKDSGRTPGVNESSPKKGLVLTPRKLTIKKKGETEAKENANKKKGKNLAAKGMEKTSEKQQKRKLGTLHDYFGPKV